MIQRHGAQNRLRAYTEHMKDRHSLGSEFAYGPEFGAANNRPAGMYALDRDDLVAVLDELDELREVAAREVALREAAERIIEHDRNTDGAAKNPTPGQRAASAVRLHAASLVYPGEAK